MNLKTITTAQRLATVLERLAGVVGAAGLTTDPDVMAPWLTDWRGRYHGRALAMVSPASVAQVAAVVRVACDHGIALVPQGGNTGTVGGATPSAEGDQIILSLRRLNRIRSVDAAASLCVAEAGVILGTLHAAAAAVGQRFPLTLAAKGSATIGGLVSTNAGGTQVLRFGTMRALVHGLEAVMPDGGVYDGLSALRKDNRGYDLTQLLIGAEGTLGVVTAASLRLVPAIGESATAWVGLASPHAALALLRQLEAASGDAIESFELIARPTLMAAIAHRPDTRAPLASDHAWHVLIDYVGPDAHNRLAALLIVALEAGGIEAASVAQSGAQAAAMWAIRESLSAAEKALGPAIQHDLSVPVAALPDFLIEAATAVEARFAGTLVTGFGHLGDGNIHFHVRAPRGALATWRQDEGTMVARFVNDLAVAAGGSISAEHGIGQSLRAELLRLSSPTRIAALRAIKSAIDPAGIFNPGKLIPLASDATAA